MYNSSLVSFNQCVSSAKCSNPGKGDGLYDSSIRQWIEYPCGKKDCPRHWRRYAIKTLNGLRNRMRRQYQHYYHVRLSAKMHLAKGQQFRQLRKFVDKIFASHTDAQIVAVLHSNKAGHHFHLLICLNRPLTIEQVRQHWKAHFPAKRKTKWKNEFVYLKYFTNPIQLIRYALLGKVKEPRTKPPWYGPNQPKTPWKTYMKQAKRQLGTTEHYRQDGTKWKEVETTENYITTYEYDLEGKEIVSVDW